MMHIGLNAQLLSAQAGYRAAGIHNVIHRLLQHLPAQAPADWQFSAFVGRHVTSQYERVAMRRTRFDADSPLQRIVWEQAAQPWQLGRYDLVHMLAFVAPLVLLRPMVLTVYDLTFLRYPERLSAARRAYLQALTPLSCQRARRITVISASTKHDLVTLLNIPPEKVDVTPLGYDEALMRPLPAEQVAAFRRAKALPEAFWLFIGTIEPRKNLPLLLEAYAQLKPSERLPLLIGGGAGWGMEALHAAIQRHHLTDDVRLLGFVPADELPLWYNSASAFVYPSVFEGFGLPVLEAMACGTPVLTSNVSSLPEVAGQAGLCLPPDDAEAWADGLRRAHDDSAWRTQARAAGLRDAQQFRWERTAQLTIATYQHALMME